MKNQDVRTLIEALRSTDVELPNHQSALREQLLTIHAVQRSSRQQKLRIDSWLLHTRAVIASRKIVSAGLAVGVIVLALGLLLLLPVSGRGAERKFIAGTNPASQPTQAGPTRVICGSRSACAPGGRADTPQVSSATPPTIASQTTPSGAQDSSNPTIISPEVGYVTPVPEVTQPQSGVGSSESRSPATNPVEQRNEISISITVNPGAVGTIVDDLLPGNQKKDKDKDKEKENKAAKENGKIKPAKL